MATQLTNLWNSGFVGKGTGNGYLKVFKDGQEMYRDCTTGQLLTEGQYMNAIIAKGMKQKK
jgi:hypothetical protein